MDGLLSKRQVKVVRTGGRYKDNGGTDGSFQAKRLRLPHGLARLWFSKRISGPNRANNTTNVISAAHLLDRNYAGPKKRRGAYGLLIVANRLPTHWRSIALPPFAASGLPSLPWVVSFAQVIVAGFSHSRLHYSIRRRRRNYPKRPCVICYLSYLRMGTSSS